MATPTPSTNTPSKQLHTFSSPAPRSVPHTGGANMLTYDSPAVLNMLNDASVGMGGVGMGISMSGLGMSSMGFSASSAGRADEAERTRRLQSIIETVGAKPGRASEEGLLALCKGLGIPYEKHPDEPGTWSLLIGDEAVCDVTFTNDETAKVNLQSGLDEEKPELHFGATGSQILVKSLRPRPGQTKINATLEPFAESLQKLLVLDKLGSSQGVSCYNAIAGVYTSLRKLFEHEKKTNLATRDESDRFRIYKSEREVLCKKSGRPRLNAGSCLGLSLEYWMHRRHIMPRNATIPSEKGKEKMEIDEPETLPEDEDGDDHTLYSMTLECEASPSTLFTPIRISSEWIAEGIEKPVDENDANASIDNILNNAPSIDWLDPKPTYLEAAPQGDDTMNLDAAAGRLPNIRFVAKFNPPLVIPLAVHVQLYQLVGIEPRSEDFRATTFLGLALRPGEVDPGMMGLVGETHAIQSSQSVVVVDAEGKETERQHDMSLYIPKMEYSRTLESLPFSHPKQLIEILPVLRQYAATTSLLRESFYEKAQTLNQSSTNGTAGSKDSIRLDLNLSYTPPAPRITLHVPHPLSSAADQTAESTQSDPSGVSDLLASLLGDSPAKHSPVSINLDIHANGELVVSEQNLIAVPKLQSTNGDDKDGANVDMEEAVKVQDKVKRLAKALDVCGNLSVWGEWLRREVVRMSKQ